MPGLGATDPADLEAQARAELGFSRRPMYSLLSLRPTVIQATLKKVSSKPQKTVNVAGGVCRIRRDLTMSRGGTSGKGGIANTPLGEGEALGNDVMLRVIILGTKSYR
jgi:hypothetical protein